MAEPKVTNFAGITTIKVPVWSPILIDYTHLAKRGKLMTYGYGERYRRMVEVTDRIAVDEVQIFDTGAVVFSGYRVTRDGRKPGRRKYWTPSFLRNMTTVEATQ